MMYCLVLLLVGKLYSDVSWIGVNVMVVVLCVGLNGGWKWKCGCVCG